MKKFRDLTIGEIKNLSDQDIDLYSAEVGEREMIENHLMRSTITKEIGKRVIKLQIKKLQNIDTELTGL